MKYARFNSLSAEDAEKVTYLQWVKSGYIAMWVGIWEMDFLETTIRDLIFLPVRIALMPVAPFVRAWENKRWAASSKDGVYCADLGPGLCQSYMEDAEIYGRHVDDFDCVPDSIKGNIRHKIIE